MIAFNRLGRLYARFAPRKRDHRKILVVDGRVAFTGGLNIGNEYYGGPEDSRLGWRDAHALIEGPAVRDLEAVFLESWFRADGPGLIWNDFLDRAPPPCGDSRCAVLADGPVYRRRRTRALLIGALGDANATAGLTSPYFAPGRRVLEALARAGQRGVRVDLLLAGRSDHPVLRRAARAKFSGLLRAEVRVFEYERTMMHAKTAVFDDSFAVIGALLRGQPGDRRRGRPTPAARELRARLRAREPDRRVDARIEGSGGASPRRARVCSRSLHVETRD